MRVGRFTVPARADVAIDAGQLGIRVNRMIGFEVLIVMLL
ncbi:Uncharacterised protein [Klebsiella variicola]|uniref:Uncharacterized protein n=1 Tax=Klebsiella variicola TaxID=244366 RepID=A0A7H4MHS5_KLEVA|nr:Uncharacterised protein [Klebsiella variicola]